MAHSQQPRILIVDSRDAPQPGASAGPESLVFSQTSGGSALAGSSMSVGFAFTVPAKTALIAVGVDPQDAATFTGSSRRLRVWISPSSTIVDVLVPLPVGRLTLPTMIVLEPDVLYTVGVDVLAQDKIQHTSSTVNRLIRAIGFNCSSLAGVLGFPAYPGDQTQRGAGQLWVGAYIAAPPPNYDSFVVTLKPAICGLKGVRLLYCNVGNPEDNSVDLYWLLRVGEFGTPARTANSSDGATFVIPVASAQGYRTLHRSESDFEAIALQQPATDIHRLTVDLMLPGGTRPSVQEPWYFILKLDY